MNSDSHLQIGYCTNVHAGTTLNDVRRNLEEYSLEIKKIISPESPLGLGMWLGSKCADQLSDLVELKTLRSVLRDYELVPFTFNGFPYGDFHQSIVKQNVYQPNWANERRLQYTIQLAEIQNQLLPAGMDGSISTLPLAWPIDGFSRLWNQRDLDVVQQSARNLKACAGWLHELYERTGRRIRVAIEPEPGCLIDNWEGVVEFFNQFLCDQNSTQNEIMREYMGVCHDVCHSAVMFESQHDALRAYSENQIRVVKVQVSSAIEMDFDALEGEQKTAAINQLAPFAEDRYLHQTNVKLGGRIEFFEDLPLALKRAPREGVWRVHYHVPLFLDRFHLLGTTQFEIAKCVRAMEEFHPQSTHFEVETYAWNVLPDELRTDSLQSGIAREIGWFRQILDGV